MSGTTITTSAEIYSNVTGTWQSGPSFPDADFKNSATALLPNGDILAGSPDGPQTYIFDVVSNTWSYAAPKLRGDESQGETWITLPDGSILSYDSNFSGTPAFGSAQRYLPWSNTWVDAGTVPVQLGVSGHGTGPGFLLPDGQVFVLGATGKTAYYTPSTNTWSAGPAIPSSMTASGYPGAMMPNGHILFAAANSTSKAIFEFDPTTDGYTDVTPGSGVLTLGSSTSGLSHARMLALPSGQVLVTSGSA